MAEQTVAPPASNRTHIIEARQMLTLHDISWDQYVAITDALPDRAGLRTSYDGETLELMTTSHMHEMLKKFLGRLFETLTLELDIDIHCGGQTTFRREDLAKGLEPDQCYWIAHEEQMRQIRNWVPDRDPPPDLAIEIDVSRSSVDRQSIYAKLGTEEIWRYDGKAIRTLQRQASGTYEPIESSVAVPGLDAADLLPFLHRLDGERENAILRSFIEWIHETLR